MTTQIEIKFYKQPQAGQTFGFTIVVGGVVSLSVNRVFGNGAAGTVAIGANLAATVANTAANLTAGTTNPSVVYTAAGNSVFANFTNENFITVFGLHGTPDYVGVYESNPESSTAPFDIWHFGIEIIDTYTNDRVLIEETATANGLRLIWDGGDDVFQPMMTSKLSFDMHVYNGEDGHFLHLLTGDEQRFLVRLRNIAADGTGALLWQGFVLADLYQENWQKHLLFVKFEATDMLALLKGKYFEPWYYNNVFNLPELLGYILAETGLVQEMYIAPTLVNVSLGDAWQWRNLNLDLRNYFDGKKYDDLYTILEKILVAQGMQITTWRGKWHLRGITRRGELSGDVEIYYPDGHYKETVTLTQQAFLPIYSNTPPLITANVPYKKVNVNFSTDSVNNLLPEEIVVQDFVSAEYFFDHYIEFVAGGAGLIFSDKLLNKWNKNSSFLYDDRTFHAMRFNYNPLLPSVDYNVAEGVALQNYFEANEHPSVVPGRKYELDLEIEVHFSVSDSGNFADNLKNGVFDRIIPIQLFLTGAGLPIELISNRPGFAEAGYWPMVKDAGEVGGSLQVGVFKMQRSFTVNEPGTLTLRLLTAIDQPSSYGVLSWTVFPKAAKVNVLGDIEDIESATAVRNIKFTRVFDIDLDITCTTDTSIQNSFGIAPRLLDRFRQIAVADVQDAAGQHIYQPTVIYVPGTTTVATYIERTANLALKKWQISDLDQFYIFKAAGQNSLYLQSANGAVPYASVLTNDDDAGNHYMAVVTGYTATDGQSVPQLPDTFEYLPAPAVDEKLMIMQSLFAVEDRTKRALWKIHGFADDTALNYTKTLASAVHAVRPQLSYNIDCTTLALVFPLMLPLFPFMGVTRVFMPTRIEADLFNGKTNITMSESLLSDVTDITFE